ncbi:hypothetical protein PBRA_001541 [Plasmodiophora brassicae]|uniref:Prolyl 4-hydroxylase alpha subunit domain-containing protein n=1 Tax=Plasmodiophora brassicae TaxID=37360 RepID=A0A0G4IYZ5_PLABS|nr:hypothetical protein PBRA_001541 [Plasmodiophora brassicae]
MVTQSVAPRVFVIEDFLSADECDHIVHLAASRGMHRSLVKSTTVSTSWFGASSPVVVSDERTSTNTWLSATASNIVENVFIRAFDLLKIPFDADRWRQHCEDMQVLRYDVSQEYSQDDYFLPATTRYSRHVQSGHNRYATLLLYLNDVAHGGETVFPRAHSTFIENGCPNSSSAMKIQPKKGRAVLFFSMRPDGNLDQSALHGGCPVIEGTKWAANLWFWDERYGK